MPDLPPALRHLPRQHPAAWMPVLLGEFVRRGDIRLHVVALRKNVAADVSFERNGVTFHVLKTWGGCRAPSLFWLDTVLIRRLLRRVQPDVVHAWGTERGAAMVASRLKTPSLVTVQGLLGWYETLLPVSLHDRFAGVLERISLRRAKVATAESVFAAGYVREHYPNLRVLQAEYAPNEMFHRVRRSPVTTPPRLLSVGSLCLRKGSDLLLRALGRLCGELSFECVFVASPDEDFLGPLRAELPAALWERIRFKPGLRQDQVASEMESATIMVLPTRADTGPMAVKEAAVAGVPVVGTRIGGIPDYVAEGASGLLCDSGDVEGLVSALRGAMRHPLFSRGRVDEAALARVRDYLSPGRMAQSFSEAYRTVGRHKPEAPPGTTNVLHRFD